MRVCIYGAGAIGGFLGVALARAGCEVSLVARGPHLAAIRENGLTLLQDGQRETVRLNASEDPAELGPQDHVIVALKAHSVPAVAEKMTALFHDGTSVVTAVNGVPWWYFHGLGGDLEGTRLESVDPGGVQWDTLGPERAIGCVVYPACEIEEPGVITHQDGDRFTLGEPSGEKTERVQALSEAMRAGGLKAPVRPRIRDEIWVKLWGNLSFNPISALTGATLEQICRDPETRAVARAMMVEGQTVGEALGVKFAIDVDKRIAGAEAVGAHKTSMLQDLERGRAMEIDALVASVQELGRLTGVATPTIDLVLGMVKMRGRTAGCY
ncbi:MULTISPECIES: 2-dehydropantoate 2-reductase [Thalassobaculum]|uniref:2-dehydropantoate 2-reductase n=1 Tax=Thalassobaculum litoreum DSM 18839 TaxID=1123362 RepID=A0A8G2BDQ2_9PROT|nr:MULTISPECIES: 2-dehydropantoate 2-reductase [Thalassobaculum]SDF04229.1 ketopantoate reductase [Thalassobaculum litoreum DSM 18839]